MIKEIFSDSYYFKKPHLNLLRVTELHIIYEVLRFNNEIYASRVHTCTINNFAATVTINLLLGFNHIFCWQKFFSLFFDGISK